MTDERVKVEITTVFDVDPNMADSEWQARVVEAQQQLGRYAGALSDVRVDLVVPESSDAKAEAARTRY